MTVTNPHLAPPMPVWGVVGHNIDRCIITQLIVHSLPSRGYSLESGIVATQTDIVIKYQAALPPAFSHFSTSCYRYLVKRFAVTTVPVQWHSCIKSALRMRRERGYVQS